MASSGDDGGSAWGKVGVVLAGIGLGVGTAVGIRRWLEPRPRPLPGPLKPLSDARPTPREVPVDDPPVRESQVDVDLEVKLVPKPKRKPKPSQQQRSTPAPKERRARAPRRGPVFIPDPVEPEPVEVEPWMSEWADELAEKVKEADRKHKS